MTTITFQGELLQLSENLPVLGSQAPDFCLANNELNDITLKNFEGKRKILNIVPSLDTPTCASSARRFNQKAGQLENTIVLMISADLPFAQCRFCEIEGLHDVLALSTFRSSFAKDYGVEITNGALRGLTARAVVVLNEENQVIYTQLVSELANEPDYEAVFMMLK